MNKIKFISTIKTLKNKCKSNISNLLTRTRKTIGPEDLLLFRPMIIISLSAEIVKATYPFDKKLDPFRKIKEISRYEFLAHFLKGKKILDIGSGSFYGPKILAEKAGKVVGIEASSLAVKQAKSVWKKINNLTCLQGMDLSCITEKFDAATSINVIEHMPTAIALNLLKDIHKHLEKGGILFLATPRDRSKLSGGKYENPDHKKEYNEIELEDLITKAGFEIAKRYIQNMTSIKEGKEKDVDPAERAWFLWELSKSPCR